MKTISEDKVRRMLHDLADQAPQLNVALLRRDQATAPQRPPVSRVVGVVAAAAAVAAIVGVAPVVAWWNSDAPTGSTGDPGFAESDPADGTSSTSPRPELASADQVRAVAARLDLYRETGYGKVTIDIDARVVRVFWHGTAPAAVTEAVDSQPNGVRVELIQTEYSAADLEAAGEKVLAYSRQPGAIPVTHVGRIADLSGIRVGITAEDMPEDTEAMQQLLEVIAGGVPVLIEEGSPVVGLVPGTDHG